jgi:hypothetical protein
MPHRVDATVNAVKLTSSKLLGDSVLPHTRFTYLGIGDDAMLPPSKTRNNLIGVRVAYFPHGWE